MTFSGSFKEIIKMEEKSGKENHMGVGIAIGLAIGLVIGLALENMILGLPLGIAVGIGIGILWDRQRTMDDGAGKG